MATAPEQIEGKLERSIRDYATRHGLTAISWSFHPDSPSPFSAFVHREGRCKSGYGNTVSEALGAAFAQIETPVASIADEPLSPVQPEQVPA